MYRTSSAAKYYLGLIFATLTAAGLVIFPVTSYAAKINWYGGLSVGGSRHDATGNNMVGPGFVGSIDDTDTAFKIFGGMPLFDKYLAAEAGYIFFGTAEARGTVGGLPARTTTESGATFLAVKGLLPVTDQIGLFIKYGLAGTFVNLETAGASLPAQSTSNTTVFAGAGVQFDLSKRMSARFEMERYTMGSLGSKYINLATLGVTYRFRK